MDKNHTAIQSIAYLAQYYGHELSLASLKKSFQQNNPRLEKISMEHGIKLKRINCSLDAMNYKCLFPLIAELKTDKNEISYCYVIKADSNKVYFVEDENVKMVSMDDFNKYFNGRIYLSKVKNNFAKKESLMDIMRFTKVLKPERKNIVRIFLASIMLCLFGVLTAFYFRFLIDEVLSGGLEKMLNAFTLAFLVIILFQTLLNFARNQLLNFLAHKIDANIIVEYFSHVLKLPMNFFSKYKTGELISRMYDASVIRSLISTTFVSVAIDAVMLVFGAIFLTIFGSELIIVSIVSVVIGSIITKIFAKPYRAKMYERSQAEAEKQSLLVEFLNGVENIKSTSGIYHASEKAEEKIIYAARKNLNIKSIANLQHTIQYFIQQLGTMFTYWIGGMNIINGNMSLGQLISYVILSQYFIGPLFRFLTLQPTFQEAETAAHRLAEIFDECIEEQEGTQISDGKLTGNIQFENVSFTYDKNKSLLSNINLSIESGKKIAFVGESGSGKSTTAKLLMKFQNINSGSIRLDGKNIDDYSIEFLRTRIGYMPQEALLFSGTIAENISFGTNFTTPTQILDASISANADSFIQNLSHRYETYVGERGATLSGGEKQRIAIARTILKNPDIYIFDESTSALDSIVENKVMDFINEKLFGKTVIMISHKLSTIKNFDMIYVFDHGEIIEAGTHDELLLMKGKYYKLWMTQNKEEVYEKIA